MTMTRCWRASPPSLALKRPGMACTRARPGSPRTWPPSEDEQHDEWGIECGLPYGRCPRQAHHPPPCGGGGRAACRPGGLSADCRAPPAQGRCAGDGRDCRPAGRQDGFDADAAVPPVAAGAGAGILRAGTGTAGDPRVVRVRQRGAHRRGDGGTGRRKRGAADPVRPEQAGGTGAAHRRHPPAVQGRRQARCVAASRWHGRGRARALQAACSEGPGGRGLRGDHAERSRQRGYL
ncbi:hypothetical protein G6F65_018347 [Rhizopus arrhizus]|nr:hypothetical protein G6F65_018347 [Rhizopus arrhizus]